MFNLLLCFIVEKLIKNIYNYSIVYEENYMLKHPKYPNGTIYLSGGMQFAANLGAEWRKRCGERLKEMGFFPLDITELDVAYSNAHGQTYGWFQAHTRT